MIILFRFRSYGYKLGFEIPVNVFGAGLSIVHHGPIIVNADARIGENCRIHPCVTIGFWPSDGNGCPIIGDNTFIGPGAKIFGKITIANSVTIGANSVVNKSFLEEDISIAGSPAKKVSDLCYKAPNYNTTKLLRKKLSQ